MDIFSIKDVKIRYWENVRDVPKFIVALESSYGISADYYILEEKFDFYSLDFTEYKINENHTEIEFIRKEEKINQKEELIGWPEMTDREIHEHYSFSEINLILFAKEKWTRGECQMWERPADKIPDPNPFPEKPIDFPSIPRKSLIVKYPDSLEVVVGRVKVRRYEV